MQAILWLGEPGSDDPRLVGGKAAQLSRLAASYPVPPAFCLTTAAYDRFARTSESPDGELARLVATAYGSLGQLVGTREPAVAVRSSAVDEDSAAASFAGMYVTYLNVRGLEGVSSAIARCWAAAGDPRVKAYRDRGTLPGAGDDRVGLLVQSLVPADVAAVVFSVHPTSGNTNEIVINSNYGLGESIVSGLATPDTWVLRKSDLSTLQMHVGAKEQMTALGDHETHQVPVLRTLRVRPSLDEAKVLELARLAIRLEKAVGRPVDLECAFRAERLFLLQCRPVTTIRRPSRVTGEARP